MKTSKERAEETRERMAQALRKKYPRPIDAVAATNHDRNFFNNIYCSKRLPRLLTVVEVADICGISVRYLLTGFAFPPGKEYKGLDNLQKAYFSAPAETRAKLGASIKNIMHLIRAGQRDNLAVAAIFDIADALGADAADILGV